MQEIGSELALLQLKGTIEDYDEFLQKYGKELHPNHYHMLTAKHTLLQMLGRTEGCLIQDMPQELVSLFQNEGWNFSLLFNVPRGERQCFQSIPSDGSACFFHELKTIVLTRNRTSVIPRCS